MKLCHQPSRHRDLLLAALLVLTLVLAPFSFRDGSRLGRKHQLLRQQRQRLRRQFRHLIGFALEVAGAGQRPHLRRGRRHQPGPRLELDRRRRQHGGPDPQRLGRLGQPDPGPAVRYGRRPDHPQPVERLLARGAGPGRVGGGAGPAGARCARIRHPAAGGRRPRGGAEQRGDGLGGRDHGAEPVQPDHAQLPARPDAWS